MAKETLKNVRKEKFTMIANEVLGNEKLTLEAKGLLAIFLSNSADWELYMSEVFKRSKNGRDKHYKVVKELIEHGYFARIELREGGKFSEIIYVFSDDKQDVIDEVKQYEETAKEKGLQPFTENQDTVKKQAVPPFPEKPDTVKPKTEKPYTVDQDNNNTNPNNTKENNTKENNINQSNKLVIVDQLNVMLSDNALPTSILQVMNRYKDRLIDENIFPIDVKVFYDNHTEHKLDDVSFVSVLTKVLRNPKPIENFYGYMKRSARNYLEEYEADHVVKEEESFEDFWGLNN